MIILKNLENTENWKKLNVDHLNLGHESPRFRSHRVLGY